MTLYAKCDRCGSEFEPFKYLCASELKFSFPVFDHTGQLKAIRTVAVKTKKICSSCFKELFPVFSKEKPVESVRSALDSISQIADEISYGRINVK